MYKTFLAIAVTILCLIVCECSGGFGSDGTGADELGPAIFGTDTT